MSFLHNPFISIYYEYFGLPRLRKRKLSLCNPGLVASVVKKKGKLSPCNLHSLFPKHLYLNSFYSNFEALQIHMENLFHFIVYTENDQEIGICYNEMKKIWENIIYLFETLIFTIPTLRHQYQYYQNLLSQKTISVIEYEQKSMSVDLVKLTTGNLIPDVFIKLKALWAKEKKKEENIQVKIHLIINEIFMNFETLFVKQLCWGSLLNNKDIQQHFFALIKKDFPKQKNLTFINVLCDSHLEYCLLCEIESHLDSWEKDFRVDFEVDLEQKEIQINVFKEKFFLGTNLMILQHCIYLLTEEYSGLKINIFLVQIILNYLFWIENPPLKYYQYEIRVKGPNFGPFYYCVPKE